MLVTWVKADTRVLLMLKVQRGHRSRVLRVLDPLDGTSLKHTEFQPFPDASFFPNSPSLAQANMRKRKWLMVSNSSGSDLGSSGLTRESGKEKIFPLLFLKRSLLDEGKEAQG